MPVGRDASKWLRKKAKLGMRGYPVGTVAFYGPDNLHATKAVATVIPAEGQPTADLRRWIVEGHDLRKDDAVLAEISAFLKAKGPRTVGITDGILGCPHEEGVDYPQGGVCPACPYWAGRDRWTGALI